MKHFLLTLGVVISTTSLLFGQSAAKVSSPASTYIHCSKFYVSKPMRDMPDFVAKTGKNRATKDGIRRKMHPKNTSFHLGSDYSDPVKQSAQGTRVGTIAPIENFEGMSLYYFDPPDPNGAVGDSLYVETINSTFAVYNKNGSTVMPIKDLGALWPSGGNEDGDPICLFDKFADRWFISEFQDTATPYGLWVAVSKTSDPTGQYYVWEFNMGNTDPDYPKYAIWNNGYYVTFQGFGSFNAISPQEMAVMERNRMLEGSPSAGMIIANLPSQPSFAGDNNSIFASPKVFDCDASALPPYGTPDFLIFFQDSSAGGASNKIIMDSLVVDTAAHTFRIAEADSFEIPTFNDYFSNGNFTDISQPGDSHGVDALDGTFNYRVPYSVFPGYNSVVLSNTVNTGGMVAGIRWYELRQDNITKVWSIHQNGTYAPNDGISRWNGAICQDYDGNIAMEYSVADSVSVYPGIRYTGRLASDPLGQMTFAEQTAIAGSYTLSQTGGRWGDYSELDIDPSDGLTFWGTNEYGGTSDNATQNNRIFSFKLAGASGINEVQNKTDLRVYQNGNFLNVTATGLPGNAILNVDLFDISGRQLSTQQAEPVANSFETKINVSTLPKGVYFVRIGRTNFQRIAKTVIN